MKVNTNILKTLRIMILFYRFNYILKIKYKMSKIGIHNSGNFKQCRKRVSDNNKNNTSTLANTDQFDASRQLCHLLKLL